MVRDALLGDPAVTAVLEIWKQVSVALLGVGSVEPSPLLQCSGNANNPTQQAELMHVGRSAMSASGSSTGMET
jgi:DNA-binding transcriptional regulator LsrR (DeoR family)